MDDLSYRHDLFVQVACTIVIVLAIPFAIMVYYVISDFLKERSK